jgi:hypothetical protein
MALYIFYNADFLKIPVGDNEDVVGFGDDSTLMAIEDGILSINVTLCDIMRRRGGSVTGACTAHERRAEGYVKRDLCRGGSVPKARS